MNIRTLLDQYFSTAFTKAALPEGSPTVIKPSSRPEFGQYQVNGIMGAAKKLKKNPREIAQTVIEQLDIDDIADKIEVAGPGFINIHLKAEWLSQQLEAARQSDQVGIAKSQQPMNIVVDYSGPNLAKEMHVGHLRSTIIGDAVVRTLELLGHHVIRQNHVGDWGTQFGMLIAHMVDQKTDNESDLSIKLADLESFYRDAKLRFDEDEAFAETARDYVVKLQSGDEQCKQLWQQFIDISLQHCEEVYEQLNVSLSRDDVKPESSYNDDLPNVIQALDEQGLLTESDGAKVVFLDELKAKDNKPFPVIVQKSDGGYLYATTDLAALRYRHKELAAKRAMYFVDARQNLHLTSVFLIAKKAGFVPDDMQLEHLAFGTMMGEDGKPFKTRTGGTVKLIDLLNEAEERAYALVAEKNPDLSDEEKKQIAHKVGIGAVKYVDLSKNRTSDYIFNWDTMLSFEGNTAPYLQYAYTRIHSIFKKADSYDEQATIQLNAAEERQLAVKILQCEEAIEQVAKDATPNTLCNYLYELAGNFMTFYEACPILKADDDIKNSRLKLAQLTADTLKLGLGLLGIETMEQM